jgi:hypothetical protein
MGDFCRAHTGRRHARHVVTIRIMRQGSNGTLQPHYSSRAKCFIKMMYVSALISYKAHKQGFHSAS